jgi:hypothetical protein
VHCLVASPFLGLIRRTPSRVTGGPKRSLGDDRGRRYRSGRLFQPHTYSANNPITVNASGVALNPIFVTGPKRGILA